MQLRSILRHAHTAEASTCIFCSGKENHTTTHVISRCSFPPTQRKRAEEINRSSITVKNYLSNMTTTQLSGVLGGHSQMILHWLKGLEPVRRLLPSFRHHLSSTHYLLQHHPKPKNTQSVSLTEKVITLPTFKHLSPKGLPSLVMGVPAL